MGVNSGQCDGLHYRGAKKPTKPKESRHKVVREIGDSHTKEVSRSTEKEPASPPNPYKQD